MNLTFEANAIQLVEQQIALAEQQRTKAWINLSNPCEKDVRQVADLLGIPLDFLTDPLDVDERARLDIEDGVTLLVIRAPVVNDADTRVPYVTLPIGVVITPHAVVTICRSDKDLVSGLLNGRARTVLHGSNGLCLPILLLQRVSIEYLTCLKEINRQTSAIEEQLQLSMRNKELIDLLNIEKSLVYFITSLKANEIIMEKLLRGRCVPLDEEEQDLLEDAITENRQAIGMSNIYSNILSGMMDAFASIISNNMSKVMKFLTGFTLILMIPNIVSGIYGMNIATPFQQSPHAFLIVAGITGLCCALAWTVFIKKRWL